MINRAKAMLVVVVVALVIATTGCMPNRLNLSPAQSAPHLHDENDTRTLWTQLPMSISIAQDEFLVFDAGYRSESDMERGRNDYITEISKFTVQGNTGDAATISNCNLEYSANIEDSVCIGDSVIFMKSHIPVWDNENESQVIAIDADTFREKWRYQIDRNLSVIHAVGDFLLVSEYEDMATPAHIEEGSHYPDLNRLKSRVLLDSDGKIVATQSEGVYISKATGMFNNSFYGIAQTDSRDAHGYIVEMSRNLEVKRTIELPSNCSDVAMIEIVASEEYGIVLLSENAVYRIDDNGLNCIAEATGILEKRVINNEKFHKALIPIIDGEDDGIFSAVLSCATEPNGDGRQEMIYIEYDMRNRRIDCTRLYPIFAQSKTFTRGSNGSLSVLLYEQDSEYSVMTWG